MLFSGVAVLQRDGSVLRDAWVATQGCRIVYVSQDEPQDRLAYGEQIDARGRLLMPGMYNAHSHMPMTLLRGYAEALPLARWLNESVFPFEAKMTPEDSYWGTMLAIAEMLRFGTVSCSDMYFHSDARVRAVAESGIKANLCDSVVAIPDGDFDSLESCLKSDLLAEKVHGTCDGRIRVDYNLHAEYTTGPVIAAQVAQHAKDHGLGIHVHVSETRSEHEECKQRRGMTPVRYFESLGLFDVPVTAAHCVWVEDDDIEVLAAHGATVAANPVSNMKLGSGFAPVGKMLDAGVNVALGTDGTASNNNYDMFQDLYVLALMAKGSTLDPCCVTPSQALYAATRAGALAQGRSDCGYVEEGMRADLVLLDITGPTWCPGIDAGCDIVYAGHGGDVVMTMVDGEVLYRDGLWTGIDIERVKFEVARRARRIISEL